MKNCYYSKYEPIFGSWHITEELGSGAEGHLYRIRREDALGHVFYSALKAVSVPANGNAEIESLMAGGMSREEAEKYFRDLLENTAQEFELLAKLKGNSNIVSYEDHDIIEKDDGFGWDVLIRMEELTPLLKHSAYHALKEKEVLKLGIDICNGLEVCRKYGIVHRDIKPENIFISAGGNYKLGDFGIARMIEDSSKELSRKGTYGFMAPEIYWGKEYGHSADVYSLGLVMYRFMNDGRLPFMPVYPDPVEFRDGEMAFARRMSGNDIPEPRNGSPGLKAVILKACRYDRKNRYSTAEEMLRDLEALKGTNGEHSVLTGNGTEGKSSERKKGSKVWKIIAALVILCLTAAGIAYAVIPKEIEDIEITGLDPDTEIYMEEELRPVYAVKPDWFKDEQISFTSDDEEVFKVDSEGVIHAGKPGNAVLTVTARDYSEQIEINIVPKVTEIKGISDSISMTTGDTLTLKPVLKPKKFASEPVTYKSDKKSVAKVTDDGVITAVSAGNAVLTIAAGGTSIKCDINVSDPVIYYPPVTTGSSSAKKPKKSSGKASKGYFDSGDDEHF